MARQVDVRRGDAAGLWFVGRFWRLCRAGRAENHCSPRHRKQTVARGRHELSRRAGSHRRHLGLGDRAGLGQAGVGRELFRPSDDSRRPPGAEDPGRPPAREGVPSTVAGLDRRTVAGIKPSAGLAGTLCGETLAHPGTGRNRATEPNAEVSALERTAQRPRPGTITPARPKAQMFDAADPPVYCLVTRGSWIDPTRRKRGVSRRSILISSERSATC